jgi:hypothetical protein
MPQPLYPPAGPQSIGQVLDSAFRIFEVSLVRCLLFGAMSMIAGQLPNIYFIAAGKPLRAFGGGDPSWLLLYVVGAILTLLMFAALVLRQYGIAIGRRQSFGVEISEAIRRLPGFLGLALLGVLIGGVGPFIVGLAYAATGAAAASLLVLGIAVVVLIVPVLYLMTPLTLATPALLLDGKGPWQAIRYSVRLVKGCWWRTTAVFTVALVVIVVFYAVATVIIGMVLPLAGAADLAAVTAATAVVYVVLGAIGMPFFSAVIIATYGELKVRKEAIDLEQRIAGVAQS